MIFSRLVTLCNGTVTPSQVNKLTDEQIKSIGTANSKVTYIRNITNAVINGDLNLDSLKAKDDEVFNYLTSFKGIGKWTANMYLIFVLNRMDIIPTNDASFLQSYEWLYKTIDCSDIAIRNKCTKWQPYSSIASRYFYRALDTGLTKEKIQLY